MFKVVAKKGKNITLKYIRNISPWEGQSFDQFFSEFDGKYENILIQLHCYGGDVIEGNLIYNIMTTAKSNVDIDVIGIAASMGTVFLKAGRKRRMVRNGFLMFHRVQGSVCGNADDMKQGAKLMVDMETNFIADFAKQTGKTEDEIKDMWFKDGADHWVNAQEALDLGLIHEIIEPVDKSIKDLDSQMAAKLGEKVMFSRYAALLDDKQLPAHIESNFNNNTDMKKEELIARYKLTGVTAESSDTAIMEAIDEKFKAESDKAVKAQDELKKIKDTEIAETVEAAVKEGKITAVEGKTINEQKTTFITIGKSAGIEALKTALATAAPHKTIVSQLHSGGGTSTETVNNANRDSWDWGKWQKEAGADLENLATTDWDKFNNLYKGEYGEDAPKN